MTIREDQAMERLLGYIYLMAVGVLLVASPSPSFAGPIQFQIVSGDLAIAWQPGADSIINAGRKLRVGPLSLTVLPGASNKGHLDSGLGTIGYSVDLRADFAFFDYVSGDLIQRDSFSVLLGEAGVFDALTNVGAVDGNGPIRENSDTILVGWWQDLIDELSGKKSQILVSDEDLGTGVETPLVFLGSTEPGFYEIEIKVKEAFGGGSLRGTTTGALTAVPEPGSLALSAISLLACALIRRRRGVRIRSAEIPHCSRSRPR